MINVSSIKLLIQKLIALPDPHITIRNDIDAAILRQPPSVRRMTYRASEINSTYGCDRRLILMAAEQIFTDKEPWDPGRTLVAAAGTAMHEMLQGILAQTGKLLGHWKCPCCHQVKHKNQCMPKGYCTNTIRVARDDGPDYEMTCAEVQRRRVKYREPPWLYVELSLKTEEFGIVGRSDGIWVESDAWYVLEIKNIGTHMFNNQRVAAASQDMRRKLDMPSLTGVIVDARYMTLPKTHHVVQGAIYAGLVVDMSIADPSFPLDHRHFGGLLVLYVDRDTFDIKTFVLPDVAPEYHRAIRKAELLNAVRDTLDMTPSSDAETEAARVAKNRETAFGFKAACSIRTSESAKRCPWQLVCFPYKNTTRNVVSALPLPEDP